MESPTTTTSPNSCSSIASNNGPSPHQIPTPPITPKSTTTNTRSHEPNPNYPTTFVQADTSNFKHVVQMLTGSSDPAPPPSAAAVRNSIPPIRTKKPGFKLYERRNSLKNGLMINTLVPGFSQKPELLSPSILDFPSLVLSPATPFSSESSAASTPSIEEERAIAEKKFYFHPPSPRNGEPRLLPLFPVTSPR